MIDYLKRPIFLILLLLSSEHAFAKELDRGLLKALNSSEAHAQLGAIVGIRLYSEENGISDTDPKTTVFVINRTAEIGRLPGTSDVVRAGSAALLQWYRDAVLETLKSGYLSKVELGCAVIGGTGLSDPRFEPQLIELAYAWVHFERPAFGALAALGLESSASQKAVIEGLNYYKWPDTQKAAFRILMGRTRLNDDAMEYLIRESASTAYLDKSAAWFSTFHKKLLLHYRDITPRMLDQARGLIAAGERAPGPRETNRTLESVLPTLRIRASGPRSCVDFSKVPN